MRAETGQPPFGVLFNGKSVRVFINPDYPSFTKYKKRSVETDQKKQINFYETPVDAADDDSSTIAAVLLRISAASLSDDPASVARRMANAKIQTIEKGMWAHEVSDRLRAALSEPSDEVIRAIASVDSIWEGMEKKPEPADAVIAWHRRKETLLPDMTSLNRVCPSRFTFRRGRWNKHSPAHGRRASASKSSLESVPWTASTGATGRPPSDDRNKRSRRSCPHYRELITPPNSI